MNNSAMQVTINHMKINKQQRKKRKRKRWGQGLLTGDGLEELSIWAFKKVVVN